MPRIITQKQLRKQFWAEHPNLPRKKIPNYSGNGTMYPTDTRVAWTDWKDSLSKDGIITQEMRDNATL